MKGSNFIIISMVIASVISTRSVIACTNYMVTKGASSDGSTMITYAADSHQLYGELYFRPAADYQPGDKVKVYEWDTGKYLGEIDQVLHTYSVVGNMNEHQLSVGETTYGGREDLVDTTAIIDYGSLIYLTLQRAKNAREAIKTMSELVARYGYYSSGESFSISDANEVWIMELIGKGPGNKGAVWVARMVPDGFVCAHANQARITTFPFNKKNNWTEPKQTTFHSLDVISFAKTKGYFKGKDVDFSFSDTYAPVNFGAARFCEVRVWTFFNSVNKDMAEHWKYATGDVHTDHETGYATNRMPLWVKPDGKVTLQQVMDCMRDHLEGTELDMRNDIGAGPFGNPYRWRPLTWKVDSTAYCNERATATQQTGFSFVAQGRSWMPDPVGGINWFGVDDAASTVYIPMYCGITKVPKSLKEGNGSMMEFTFESAFWVFNMVSNLAYTRYSYIWPEIRAKQQQLEDSYIAQVSQIDAKVKTLYEQDNAKAISYVTNFSEKKGEETFNAWSDLYKYLFTRYMDGNIKKVKDGKFLNNGDGVIESPDQPGYGDDWYRKIATSTGDQFKMKGDPGH